MLLFSPVGVPEKPEEFTVERVIEMQQSKTRKFLVKRAANMWERNYSPFSILRYTGYYPSSRILKSYVNRRMKIENENEKINLKELLLQVNLRRKSSEVATTMILSFGAWAREPI